MDLDPNREREEWWWSRDSGLSRDHMTWGACRPVTGRLGKNEGSKDFASRSHVAWWEAPAEARGELLVMFVLPTDLEEGGRIERRAGCEK